MSLLFEYRNRKLGDYLKELDLTEGRGTGFPIIYNSLEANGSPAPIFETDADRNYFLSVISIHPLAKIIDKEGDKDRDVDKELIVSSINDTINDTIKKRLTEVIRTILNDEKCTITQIGRAHV